ncbi:MAG: hypothetical protein FD176_174 [Rhodospirillaceae bacterium]|nr:MAG: hypothetical protein FD176_174 [Rhodospirillaceae bacterium]TNC98692.1 MAG: hypothetical protein FD119_163 [Stygiobacter sp.]
MDTAFNSRLHKTNIALAVLLLLVITVTAGTQLPSILLKVRAGFIIFVYCHFIVTMRPSSATFYAAITYFLSHTFSVLSHRWHDPSLEFAALLAASIVLFHLIGRRLPPPLQAVAVVIPIASWRFWQSGNLSALIPLLMAAGLLFVVTRSYPKYVKRTPGVETRSVGNSVFVSIIPNQSSVMAFWCCVIGACAYAGWISLASYKAPMGYGQGVYTFCAYVFAALSLLSLWLATVITNAMSPTLIEVQGRRLKASSGRKITIADCGQDSRLQIVPPKTPNQPVLSQNVFMAMGDGPAGAALLGASIGVASFDVAGNAAKVLMHEAAKYDAANMWSLRLVNGANTQVLATGLTEEFSKRVAQEILKALNPAQPQHA